MTDEELYKELMKAVEEAGSITKLAESMDKSRGFMNRVTSKKDPISEDIARELGYQKVCVWERIEDE